jgi:hypothetical protein
MTKEMQAVKVLEVSSKVKKILVDIKERGGFIPANIELIESGIDEINRILTDKEIMENEVLNKAFAPFADHYKKLKFHYETIMKGHST